MDLQDLTSFKSPKFEPERALNTAVGASVAPLWGAFFVAASAGAAFWWMTSWTRRRAETASDVAAEPVSFAPPAEDGPAPTQAEPEEVMAHQPEPEVQAETPVEDLVTASLAVAPEEVMGHAPVEAPKPAAKRAAKPASTPVVDLAPVAEALTIETQAAIKPPMEEAPASLSPKRSTPPKSARSKRKAARSVN